jgi:hypothetical protein
MERESRKRSSSAGSEKMDRDGGREEKMEGNCSTGQSPQWAVVPMEEEEEGEDQKTMERGSRKRSSSAGSEKVDRVGGR